MSPSFRGRLEEASRESRDPGFDAAHRPGMTGAGNGRMLGLWSNKGERPTVSPDFQRALTQQILRTELIRIKALIGTTTLFASLILVIHFLDPGAVQHLWHGKLNPSDLFKILLPFILYEI